MTEWRAVPSFPDYEASDAGEIRRRTPDALGRAMRTLKQHANKQGYMRVPVSRDHREFTRPAHMLVCEAFHGLMPPNKHQVGHRNGNPSDNRPENLRWVTRQENMEDQRLHGTLAVGPRHWSKLRPEDVLRGSQNGSAKLTEDQVRAIKGDARLLKDVAADFGVSLVLISKIRRGIVWGHVTAD